MLKRQCSPGTDNMVYRFFAYSYFYVSYGGKWLKNYCWHILGVFGANYGAVWAYLVKAGFWGQIDKGQRFHHFPGNGWVENFNSFSRWTSWYPLTCWLKKKNFYLVKMLFSDLFSKFRTFPLKMGETSEIDIFHKIPKIFHQKCSSSNQEKVCGWLWLFFGTAEKPFWLEKEPP